MRTAVVLLAWACITLSGCFGAEHVNVPPGGEPVPVVTVGKPLDATQAITRPEAPGILLEAHAAGDHESYTLDAALRNDGSATWLLDLVCDRPVLEGLRRDGELVAMRAAEECTTTRIPFAPGDELPWSFAWDVTVWDDVAQAYAQAPPGHYAWTVAATLRAHADASAFDLRATFNVEVVAA